MILSIFNKIVIFLAPLLPISFIRLLAGKYVAGENYKDALKICKKLNEDGFLVTIDILGEHSKKLSDIEDIKNEYINLYKSINTLKLDCNISVKPTHLGLDISTECANTSLLAITEAAKSNNNFLRIDMENSLTTDNTINLYYNCKDKYINTGIVIQAYLYRSMSDLKKLCKDKSFNFRLCKGIYNEDSEIAIQDRLKINENFIKLLDYAFREKIYIGIATHDLSLLDAAYKLINKYKVNKNHFEFQVLYGVPMSGWLEKHLQNGYKVRVYLPFGPDWYDYSMRRLKENPNIARYILYNLLKK